MTRFSMFLQLMQKKVNSSYLLKGSLKSISAKVVTFMLGFVFQVIVARGLGASQYGFYSYVMNLAILTNTIAIFGLNTSTKRFLPAYKVKDQNHYLIGFFLFGLTIIVLLGVVVGLGDYQILVYQDKLFGEYVFFSIMGLVIFTALVDYLSSTLFGLKEPFYAAITVNGSRYAISLLLILIIVAFFKIDLSSKILIQITLIALAVTIAIQLVIVLRKLPKPDRIKLKTNEWLKVSAGLLLVGSFAAIQNRVDIQILGIYRTDQEVGIYNAIFRNAQICQFFLKAVAGVGMPIIASLYTQGKSTNEIQSKVNKLKKITFWPSFIIIVLMVLFSKYLMALFGEEFLTGQFSLYILLIGQFSIAVMGSSTMVLNMSGNHNISMKIYMFASMINVSLNLNAIPRYGILGAAISTAFVNIFISVISNYMVRKKLGINTSVLRIKI